MIRVDTELAVVYINGTPLLLPVAQPVADTAGGGPMIDDSFLAAVLAVSVVTFLVLLAGYGVVRWVLGGTDAFEEVGR